MVLAPSDDRHLAGEERRIADDERLYTFQDFLDHYGEPAGRVKWNTASDDEHLAGEERRIAPDDFYEPLSPDMAITQNEVYHIRSKYGWWLTDRQCWVRLGLTPPEEMKQTAYERRQRDREDRARRGPTSGVPPPGVFASHP